MRSSILIVTGMMIVLTLALACSKTEPGAPLPPAPAPTAAPQALKEVIREVQVPGETIVVEKEVIKTVEVPVEVIKEVVKEVQVPGETVVVEKEVIKTVEVPGETVVVEKEVVKTVEVPVEVIKEVVKEVQVPGETVVVEKEVVKTVEVVKEVAVAQESAPAAQAAQAAPAPTPAPAAMSAQAAPAPSGPVVKRAQPSVTTFKDYERSRFASTSEDDTSTFSLDTDRTSYQLALNWARAQFEVDPDSVRAEEWVNAFNYSYEQPEHRDSFAISTNVIGHPLDSDRHLARIGFQAPEIWDDKPLNVTLVLDASGSMADGDRVSIAREAAESIRRSLRDEDRIAVVHFTTEVIHNLTVEHDSPGSKAVKRSINKLEPHDSTNVQAGLNLGVQLADEVRRERPDALNYIVLMSDGVANVDATDPFAILESAADSDNANPLRLITIGVGINNYNDYLLEQLAQHGNGWYRYLSDTGEARATFSRESWLALSIPFADQTRAQVRWDPDVVEAWRMIGYENRVTSDESFTQARKEFAEIPMGAQTTVFFELELVDDGNGLGSGAVNLGEVELRWVTPDTGDSNRQHAAIVDGGTQDSMESALLEFGAIVALSSDRYSSLPHLDNSDSGYVRDDLEMLIDRMWPLEDQLGNLQSYQDFAFLLEHITDAVDGHVASRGSGYNR